VGRFADRGVKLARDFPVAAVDAVTQFAGFMTAMFLDEHIDADGLAGLVGHFHVGFLTTEDDQLWLSNLFFVYVVDDDDLDRVRRCRGAGLVVEARAAGFDLEMATNGRGDQRAEQGGVRSDVFHGAKLVSGWERLKLNVEFCEYR